MMIREVHGMVAGDAENEVRVRDDERFVRLSIGNSWQQLTPEQARFLARALTKSANRVASQTQAAS